MRPGERTDLVSIETRLSLEQAAELLCALATISIQKWVCKLADPQSVFLHIASTAWSISGDGFGAFALALARAAQFVYRLPGEPLQVPNELFAGRNLFCIIQRKLKVPAAVWT